MLLRKINICTTLLYFTMDNASISFEENSESETNVDRPNNDLEMLDVTSDKLSLSDIVL